MKARFSVCLSVLAAGLSANATDYFYTGLAPTPPPAARQDWFNPQNWSPSTGVPGPNDTASIVGFTVTLTAPVIVKNLTLVESTLTGGSLTVNGTLEVRVRSLATAV